MSYLVLARPFVTDANEAASSSAAFLAFRAAFFLAALDFAAAFALSRSALQGPTVTAYGKQLLTYPAAG